MKPPSGGPITGPISAGTVSQASEPTNSCFGTASQMTSRPTGTIIAPPIPCTTGRRRVSRHEPERPQRIEPIVKSAIARRKMVRAP